MGTKSISKQTLQRLPLYISYLKSLPECSSFHISATAIAVALKMGEVQVRKDLAAVSNAGKPKIGYNAADLIAELEAFLGYNDTVDAIIVGAGKLGKALLDYSGFRDYGLNIIAAFDQNEEDIVSNDNGKQIFPLSKFEDLCSRLKIRIGIITVPAENAQAVCNLMVKNGILAIWNFAPIHLLVPSTILVQNENMASSLALLSKHLSDKMSENNKNQYERNVQSYERY